MRLVIQRVSEASVKIENEIVGKINKGIIVLLGIHADDSKEQADWLISKLIKLRIFNDENGKMNLSIEDIKGSFLVISQFTLYGNAKKGTRPSYIHAARPETAIPLYEYFITELRKQSNLKVQTGEFGAMMDVSLINEGPVTLVLEK